MRSKSKKAGEESAKNIRSKTPSAAQIDQKLIIKRKDENSDVIEIAEL